MKRNAMAMIVAASGIILSSAAYAQGAHDHGTPKSAPGASQGHDANCCKPDPSDMKGMQGMAEHDHAQTSKKPAAKKRARTPAAKEKGSEAK